MRRTVGVRRRGAMHSDKLPGCRQPLCSGAGVRGSCGRYAARGGAVVAGYAEGARAVPAAPGRGEQ